MEFNCKIGSQAAGDEMLWYSQGEYLGFSSKPVVRSLVQSSDALKESRN